MKDYIRTYLEGMGYDTDLSFQDLFVPCELCEKKAVDVHHIHARGMGGTNEYYSVHDLMALCRLCHEETGDNKVMVFFLIVIHKLRYRLRTIQRVVEI